MADSLKPQVASDELNAELKAAGINKKDLEFTVGKDGSVRAEISKESYDRLLAAGGNAKVAEFLGSKFQLDHINKEGLKAEAERRASHGAANPQSYLIRANGLTEDDVKNFKDHIDVVRDALVVGDINKANEDLAKLKSAGADPKLQGIADSVNTNKQVLNFAVEGGAVVAHLDKDKMANLKAVLDSGVTTEQLFGSDKFKYDAKTGNLTVTGELTAEEKKAYDDHKGAVGVAVGGIGGQPNPDVVKQLLGVKKAELEPAEGVHHGLSQVAVAAGQAVNARG